MSMDRTGTDPLPWIPGVDLQGVIGRGASSVVYVGTQANIGRKVAVKILDLPGQAELAAKLFLAECQTLGRLTRHPNIVVVHDAGFAKDGRPYLVMEYLPGGTLAQCLASDGPLPVAEVLEVGVHLCGALGTTHRHGIVHGDVKPQNVLRARSGEVALSDFGIARLLGAASSTTRVPVFTPLHAAPELFEGSRPTERTDVYELCSTLFELLDGHPALGAGSDSPLVIVGRLAKGERRRLGDSVPPGLVEIIDRGLSIDPADRPASAAELGEALRDVQRSLDNAPTSLVILEDLPVHGLPDDRAEDSADPVDRPTLPPDGGTVPRRSGGRPLVAIGLAAAVVLAGVVATLLGLGSGTEEVGTLTTEQVAEVARPTAPSALPSSTSLTPPLVPGLQPDVTYLNGGSSTDAIDVALERTDFRVLDPDVEVFDFPAFGIQRTPALLRYMFLNPREIDECPGFVSSPAILEGVRIVAFKYGPGRENYGILQVYRFENEQEARTAYMGFSLEQGPLASECWGFAPKPNGGIADQEDFGVRRQNPVVSLPAGIEWNTWGVASADERYAFAFKVLSLRRTTVVLAIFNSAIGQQLEPAERVGSLVTGIWEQLPA
jgi:serine/threonine protein kinase